MSLRVTLDRGIAAAELAWYVAREKLETGFLYIPTHAREPQPADGAALSAIDVALNWRAGREAASRGAE